MLRSRRLWLGVIVSLVFIAIFVLRTDFGEVGDAFRDANYAWAVASVPVYFVGSWFRAWRWRYLLRPLKEMRTATLFPIVIIGFMVNNLIPARAGELARAYIVGERERVSKMAALGTIAVDRVYDGIVLLLFLLIVGAFAGVSDELRVIAISMTVLFGIGLLVLVAFALSEGLSRWAVATLLRVTPQRVKGQVEELAGSFLVGLHSFRSPYDMFAATATTAVSWLLEATMYYMIGLAFDLDLGFHIYLLVTAGANLTISIPSTPGGVGPFEVVAKETVTYFGVGKGVASAYAVALHALVLFPVIVLGLYFLWAINLSLGEVLRGPAAADKATAQNAAAGSHSPSGSGGKESGGE